ncbi:hypothetical protein HGRIS_001201 [Hohenbuehelia grisea]|uniref:Uncharacterized protein n=1 Tax=Hohenbuehelia grisea TaxID=104357 RepID=A0ABR3JQH2_9AGAR
MPHRRLSAHAFTGQLVDPKLAELIRNYLSPKYGLGYTPVPATVENVVDPARPTEQLPSSRSLKPKEIQDIIDAPDKSLDINFTLSPNNSGDGCKWEVASVIQNRNTGVYFDGLFEGGPDTIRMDVDEMWNLLGDSQVLL